MIHAALKAFERISPISGASAHCDIPCRIYDPAPAQIAALSVVRILDIMAETAEKTDSPALATHITMSRCVMRKEEEAERVKHEVRIIWGDYFKAPQFDKHADVHELAHQIMLKGSACKQGVDRADGVVLVELVNRFAEIYWATKDVKTERKICPYPPSLEVVRPVL